MPLTATIRLRFTYAWLIICYGLAAYKWVNGLWLYQVDPYLVVTRFDGVSWLLQQTGFMQAVLQHQWLQALLDGLFYGLPLGYGILAGGGKQKQAARFAWGWLVSNWLYVLSYCSYTTNSIESHTGWLLFPLLFATTTLPSFFYLMHGLRYFFLYFFFSAGVWKLTQGGALEHLTMTRILIEQHKDWLVTAGPQVHAQAIRWLIQHPIAGYALYLVATAIELLFAIGFFTKKYDKWLMAGFVAFLAFDYWVMRIPYFEVMPYLLCLYYSKYALPEKSMSAK